MRNLGVFTALVMSVMTASCAERVVGPTTLPTPVPVPKATSKPRANVEARRQAEKAIDDAFRQAMSNSSTQPEQPLEFDGSPPQTSQQPQEAPVSSTLPVIAALPPPQERAEPTIPSGSSTVELPLLPESATPILPEVSIEATMPPPEPAEPSFPVEALMPPPPEPAEPSFPSQVEIAASSPIQIPFPEPTSNLSLRPRVDWVDVVGSIEVPHEPLGEALEASLERQLSSLARHPWPLPTDAM
jgi:hypothetical protein